MKDYYYSIKREASAEIKVKGSRFIACAAPVTDETQAEAYIAAVRKKHYDATHHCTAWRLGRGDKAAFRYSDDGEPSGTAGRPILDALEAAHITNTICVVTRYYGGTKLGTGGLARAYSGAAGAALEAAEIVRHLITGHLQVAFDYDQTGIVMNRISAHQASIKDTRYSDHTELIVEIRLSELDILREDIINATAGKAAVSKAESNGG